MQNMTIAQGPSEKNVSMLRAFTNVIAGTGAFCAALHVFIGYMSLDKTPDETTGEIPSLFDTHEYIYYAYIAVFFLLTLAVSMIARRLPAIIVLPASGTVTYLLLLFDDEILLKGKMTFILFSLFVFAGSVAVSLYKTGRLHREFYRYTVAGIGVFAAGWALSVYFRAPLAEQMLFGSFKPIEDLDGLMAVKAYERLQALLEMAREGYAKHYLWSAILAFLSAAVFLLLPRLRWLIRLAVILSVPYMLIAFTFGEMTYSPMFCIVPILLSAIGMLAFTVVDPPEAVPPVKETEQVDGTEDAA